MPQESFTIMIPADFKYARIVRRVACELATILDMTFDDVSDIHLGADEAFVYACQTNTSGTVTVEFSADDGALHMGFSLGDRIVAEDDEEPSVAYAAFLIDAVFDESEITEGPEPKLRLTKHSGGGDGNS